MKNSVEHEEIRISFLKAAHILRQTIGGKYCVRRTNARVVLTAYLNNIFVKALSFVRSGDYIIARLVRESVAEVSVLDTAVSAFLLCVVSFYRSSETFIICRASTAI